MLHGCCFLLATLEKEIFCKLHKTCYTLQSRTATCNSFKISLRSLQEVESRSIASVIQCNFSCNLCCNGVARKASSKLQRVTCPLCKLFRNFCSLGCNDCTKWRRILLSATIAWNFLESIASCSLRLERVTRLLCWFHGSSFKGFSVDDYAKDGGPW